MKKYIISGILIVLGFAFSILFRSLLPLLFAILAVILILLRFLLAKNVIPGIKISDYKTEIIWLILGIFSILTSTLWYLSLLFGITSFICSIKSIKETGSTIAKVATSFSIIGIVTCVFIYVSAFMILIVNG